MRAAFYARVSTPAGQDPTVQLSRAARVLPATRLDVSAEFTDIGISGAKERQPQMDQLLAGCRKRRFAAVIVYRYDRFARSLPQLVNALGEFDALGIQFVSLHEGVDTSTVSASRRHHSPERNLERAGIPRKVAMQMVGHVSTPRPQARSLLRNYYSSRKRLETADSGRKIA
jgi:Resolvase, N terminal domain